MIVHLQKPLEKAIKAGHPWIFRDALKPHSAEPGEVVVVLDKSGNFLCKGLADAGPIGVRVFSLTDVPIDESFLAARISAALERRDALHLENTTALRLIHGEGDLLPGITLDRYGSCSVLIFDGTALNVWKAKIVEILKPELVSRSISTVLFKTKKYHEKSVVALWGKLPLEPIEVLEHGMKLRVDLINGQKTGLFLDHRDSRLRVRSLAHNKRVLNLYGYTGGFSIAAGLGGAIAVTTVDIAPAAIGFAQNGWVENGLDPECHTTVVGDVPAFMNDYKGAPFDVVISDPPSFAPKKSAVDGALRVYRLLHASVLRTMASGGIYVAASCSSHIRRDMFESTILEAARQTGRKVTIAEIWGAGKDHPTLKGFIEGNYLKIFKVLVVEKGGSGKAY